MKSLTQKLALSVLALVLTGVALATGVYAWFAVNNTTEVKNLSGKVDTASGGFLLALHNQTWGDWTTSLELDDVKVKGSADATMSAMTLKDNKLYAWNGSNNSTVATPANSGYIEFKIAVALSDEFKTVQISSLTLTSSASYWHKDKGNINADETGARKGFASNAVRVGFFNETSTIAVLEQSATAEDNTLGFDDKTNPNKAVKAYEDLAKTTLTVPTDKYASIAASTELSTPIVTSTVAANPSGKTVPNGYTKFQEVTVKVWIEGWDAEAFNEIMGGTFTLNMSFKALQ